MYNPSCILKKLFNIKALNIILKPIKKYGWYAVGYFQNWPKIILIRAVLKIVKILLFSDVLTRIVFCFDYFLTYLAIIKKFVLFFLLLLKKINIQM